MQSLFTSRELKQIDAAAIAAGAPGIVLMKRAARAAYDLARKRWPNCNEFLVVCGSGNNGGDGWVFAGLAKQAGLNARVYYTRAPEELLGDAKRAAAFALQEGVEYFAAEYLLEKTVSNPTIIVDALFGIGLDRAVEGIHARLIEHINEQASNIFALDVPSGLNADTGVVMGLAVRATATISFIADKQGMLTADAPDYCGECYLDSIGVNADAFAVKPATTKRLQAQPLIEHLQRPRRSHKGSNGHVLVCGGNIGMSGAALLASEAALCCGAGLTTLLSSESTLAAANLRLPEVMTQEANSSNLDEAVQAAGVLCVGPGLGRDDWAQVLLKKALIQTLPKVLDADALNMIASSDGFHLTGDNHVLTPHPGEAARLLRCSTEEVQQNRFQAARALQSRYGGVLVLKGAGSIVASRDALWVCDCGNPGMAVGGMGDVLAGTIAALIAQGLEILEAAQLGTWAHSYAADQLTKKQGEIGLRASELIPQIRQVLNGIDS